MRIKARCTFWASSVSYRQRIAAGSRAGMEGLSRIDEPAGASRVSASLPVRFSEHCARRSEEHTSELQSLMRISYAVFCLKKKKKNKQKSLKQDLLHTLQDKR